MFKERKREFDMATRSADTPAAMSRDSSPTATTDTSPEASEKLSSSPEQLDFDEQSFDNKGSFDNDHASVSSFGSHDEADVATAKLNASVGPTPGSKVSFLCCIYLLKR